MFRRLSLLLVVVLVFPLIQFGCGEKDVPFVVDEDELISYLEHNVPAKQLFRSDDLVNSTPYFLPGDTITRVDSLISSKRTYNPVLVANSAPDETKYVDYGWGYFREAAVEVRDKLTVQVKTVYPDSTTIDTTSYTITRSAAFLKLGNDSEDYVGWVLWGVRYGLLSSDFYITKSDDSQLPSTALIYKDSLIGGVGGAINWKFIKLSNINSVSPGNRLTVRYGWADPGTPSNDVLLLSDTDTSGLFIKPLIRDESGKLDSLSYPLPSDDERFYNLIYISTGDDAGAFVPYRLK